MSRLSPTLHAYLQLVRLPNLFTAMADVVMGFLFTHAAMGSADWRVLGLLVAASTMLYAAGVVLNDVFDLEIDSRQRPHRPLPSGRVSPTAARWLGGELIVFGLAAAWAAAYLADDFRPGLVAAALAASVLLYDGLLKRTPLGPVAMGACRTLNVLLGMSAAAGPWRDEHWLVAASIGTYIVGLTWFARKEAGRSSRWQLAAATVVMMAGVAVLAWLPERTDRVVRLLVEQPGRWWLLMTVLAVLIGYRCLWAVADPTPPRVQMAVRQGILSLVILDAAACFVVCGLEGAVAVLALLVPTVVLGRWIEST
ncbi:MAG: UbiA family prenyltransferase [Planctomycetota bacterium]|jgi:4-hydroxybenzoate polyprenyltransferase